MAEPSIQPADKAAPSAITNPPPATTIDDDSDPDFDDLDDVLDQFQASTAPPPKQEAKPTPTASGPGRPDAISNVPVPGGQAKDESEEDYLARLTSEVQSAMSQMSTDPAASASSPGEIAEMGQKLEDFARKMEEEGIKPEDFLKALLGEEAGGALADDAKKVRDQQESTSGPEPLPAAAPKTKFEDTIRRTMERMESSDTKATNATKEAGTSEEDILAGLLKAMESSADAKDGDGDLSKVFLDVMEQLTNKDMLYEPMKELDEKFPEWLAKNKKGLSASDWARYNNQQVIVKEIVGKFEEPRYSDSDSKCRDYIWERMQKMQAEGSPPEDLIANPFPGMGGIPDLSGEGEDVGCPTQ